MENRVAPLQGACKSYEEDLVLYYYAETGANERATIEQHLEQCLRCRKFVDDLGRVLPQMAPKPELPQMFWNDYFRETVAKLDEQTARQNWWRRWFAPMNGWLVPAFGTIAIAVFAVALMLEKGDFKSTTDTASVSIPAEVLVDSNQLEFFKSLEILESLSTLEQQDRAQPERKSSHTENKRGTQAA
jgi:predicted anti-sigma-YlaC factor YlaD